MDDFFDKLFYFERYVLSTYIIVEVGQENFRY